MSRPFTSVWAGLADTLFAAAIAGDTGAKVKLETLYDSQLEQSGHNSVLHLECWEGRIDRVQFILKEFANKTLLAEINYEGYTALYLAAYNGNAQVVKLLIDEARDSLPSDPSYVPQCYEVNDPLPAINCFQGFVRHFDRYKNTALQVAVEHGHVDAVKELVNADPADYRHIQSRYGETPIYIAARRGYSEILKILCRTCTAPTLDGPGSETALHAAIIMLPQASTEGSDVVHELIEAGRKYHGPRVYEFAKFLQQANEKGKNSALHLAVLGNHIGVVKQILAASPVCRYIDQNIEEKTPLYIAVERGYKDIVIELCAIPKHLAAGTKGPESRTALHAAINKRDIDCARILCEWSKKLVNISDNYGFTPFHYAARYKFNLALEMMVESYKPYLRSVPTPLWLATKEGHTSTVITLMKLMPDSCLDVNADHRNILHFAALNSDEDMVKSVLNNCPEQYIDQLLNAKDMNGDTPLHLLIDQGCFVEELIKHERIDKMARNKRNYTAFDLLYFRQDIIADQLKIKIAIDEVLGIDQHFNSMNTSSKLNSDMQEGPISKSKQLKKDANFKMAKKKWIAQESHEYKERTSTQIIVTALITTVTFTVGFTMPGGYYQSGQLNQGLVLLSKKPSFIAFMVFDALALALSTTTLLFYFLSTMSEDPRQVSKLNEASSILNIFSIITMMLTFISGTYTVLSHTPALAITICFICSIFFLTMVVTLIKMRLFLFDKLTKMSYNRSKLDDNKA